MYKVCYLHSLLEVCRATVCLWCYIVLSGLSWMLCKWKLLAEEALSFPEYFSVCVHFIEIFCNQLFLWSQYNLAGKSLD